MSKLFCTELRVSSQAILYWVEIQQDIYAFGYEAVKPPAGAESESVQLNESFLLRERYPQWWWRIISGFFFLCSSLSKWLFVGNAVFHEYLWYLWLFLRNVCKVKMFLRIFRPQQVNSVWRPKRSQQTSVLYISTLRLKRDLQDWRLEFWVRLAAGASATSLYLHFN